VPQPRNLPSAIRGTRPSRPDASTSSRSLWQLRTKTVELVVGQPWICGKQGVIGLHTTLDILQGLLQHIDLDLDLRLELAAQFALGILHLGHRHHADHGNTDNGGNPGGQKAGYAQANLNQCFIESVGGQRTAPALATAASRIQGSGQGLNAV
jgi:hypothetical protein